MAENLGKGECQWPHIHHSGIEIHLASPVKEEEVSTRLFIKLGCLGPL